MRRLPPMNSVRAFEAAVRLSSYGAAARELGVTQGAISRQIKIIENFLGTRLFRPSGRGVVPTERAVEYAAELRICLDRMGVATERIAANASTTGLQINAMHTFAMRWLIPRLPSFQQRNPRCDVRISTSSLPVELIDEPFDIVIRRAAMQMPGFACTPFLEDFSLPVCAPALLSAKPVRKPADILAHTLLVPDVPAGGIWEDWLTLSGLAMPGRPRIVRFKNFYVALHAALEGLGMLLCPQTLCADDLRSGRLVTPLRAPALRSRPICVLYPVDNRRTPRTDAFVDWLLASTSASRETETTLDRALT